MAEEQEDVKPKLNLIINYEGEHVTVKVKPDMSFKKIFEAAEKRFGKDPGEVNFDSGTFKFVFEGERVHAHETPAQRTMEDGDMIDAHLEQIGGFLGGITS